MDSGRSTRLVAAVAHAWPSPALRFVAGLFAGVLVRDHRRAGATRRLPPRQDCTLGCTESVCGRVPEGCSLFPRNNIWNTPIDTLPLDARSDAYVASIGPDTGLHPDFGAGLYEGRPLGIPFVRVPGDQPPVAITFTDAGEESDPGPYPIPPDAPIEGGSCCGRRSPRDRGARGDMHALRALRRPSAARRQLAGVLGGAV